MKRYMIFAILPVLLLASVRLAPAQTSRVPVATAIRYSGVANVARPGARAMPMRVEVKDWNFVQSATPFQVPAQGFYVAQLRSGRIVTQISGKSEKRVSGDFWTVSGVPMTITMAPHGESAQLRTITINPGK